MCVCVHARALDCFLAKGGGPAQTRDQKLGQWVPLWPPPTFAQQCLLLLRLLAAHGKLIHALLISHTRATLALVMDMHHGRASSGGDGRAQPPLTARLLAEPSSRHMQQALTKSAPAVKH